MPSRPVRRGSVATAVATALALAGLAAGCVTNPVGRVAGATAYAEKAHRTIDAARSARGTTALVVDAELTGRSLRSYTGQVVDDAVSSLTSAQDTFESIIPPDDASAALQARVLDALTATRRALVDTRTAVAGDDAQLAAAATALGPVGDRLDALSDEVGGS